MPSHPFDDVRPFIPSRPLSEDVQCCHCSYESSARGIRTHIAKAHSNLSPPRVWGRPKGPVCEFCRWVHNDTDETPREGWAERRKRFARGKIAAVMGFMRAGQGFVTLGEIAVPKGAKTLAKIRTKMSR